MVIMIGEMAERPKAAVLKTVKDKILREFESHSLRFNKNKFNINITGSYYFVI